MDRTHFSVLLPWDSTFQMGEVWWRSAAETKSGTTDNSIAHEGWPVQRFRHVELMLSEAGHSGRMKRRSGRRKMDHREKKFTDQPFH